VPRKLIPYEPYLKELARKLRNDSTLGEALLWKEINRGQLLGHDFHRQKPLLKYIVDFYCHELGLVVEIDGHYHNHEEKYNLDLQRDKELQAQNLTIIRFTEQDVRKDMLNVLRTLESHIVEHTPNPSQEGNHILDR
jgi:very-short-patch-repair endonuclease